MGDREYHVQKTAQLRSEYKTIGCMQLNMTVPQSHRYFLRGLGGMHRGVYLASLVKANDQEAIYILADRAQRVGLQEETMQPFIEAGGEIAERAKHVCYLLREARWHKAKGDENKFTDVGVYHWAAEAAIAHYVRGYHDMLVHHRTTGEPFIDVEFDLSGLRGGMTDDAA